MHIALVIMKLEICSWKVETPPIKLTSTSWEVQLHSGLNWRACLRSEKGQTAALWEIGIRIRKRSWPQGDGNRELLSLIGSILRWCLQWDMGGGEGGGPLKADERNKISDRVGVKKSEHFADVIETSPHPHRFGRGRRIVFGYQREFQWQMIHWVVGFNKI